MFSEAAVELGELIAANDIELIYGGGSVGLMGLISNTVMDAGGRVTGIIPGGLFPREIAHREISELIEVDTMHERKSMMFKRSDAFVALPGGFGTMEELTEVTTWGQIGVHVKPVGILNTDGYYNFFLAWLDRAVSDGLLKRSNRSLMIERDKPVDMLDALNTAKINTEPKWVDFS